MDDIGNAEGGQGHEHSGSFQPFEELPDNARISRDQLISTFNGTYDGKMAVRVGFAEESTKIDYRGEPVPTIMRQTDVTGTDSEQESSFESNSLVLGKMAGKSGEVANHWGRVVQGEFVPVDEELQKRLTEIEKATVESFKRYRIEQPKLGSWEFSAFYAREWGKCL